MTKFCQKCGGKLEEISRERCKSLYGCSKCDILYEQPPTFTIREMEETELKKRPEKFSEWKKKQNPPAMTWMPTGTED